MRKFTVSTAGLALGVALLAGCGDDGGGSAAGGDYCDQLKDAKAEFDSFESSEPDFSKMDEAFDTMKQLGDDAPEEVADDWKVVDSGITTMTDALDDAGITFEDLGGLSSGEMPEGVDMEKLQELGPKLQELNSEEFQTATDNIEKHAKDECDVDLSSESPS